LVSGSARAESILVNFTGTAPGAGGTTDFIYSVELTKANSGTNEVRDAAGTPISGGDYFSVADFAGYNGSTFVPTGVGTWTGSTEATTTLETSTGNTTIPGDDAGLLNVRYDYNAGGPTITGSPTALGTLTINSLYSTTTLEGFGGRYTHSNGLTTSQANVGATIVAAAVPLPPAAWGGLALLGVCGLSAWNRRRQLA
jgi:hypothetical protein